MVDSGSLENCCTLCVPGVRIPSPPQIKLNVMLKIDEKIVNEFLGTLNVTVDVVSPLKTIRTYGVGDKVILILTPMMAEDGEFLKQFLASQQLLGYPKKATEYKRGKNYVYTFEPIETVISA